MSGLGCCAAHCCTVLFMPCGGHCAGALAGGPVPSPGQAAALRAAAAHARDCARLAARSVPQRIKADFYDHFLYVSLNLVALASGSGVATEAASPAASGLVPDEVACPEGACVRASVRARVHACICLWAHRVRARLHTRVVHVCGACLHAAPSPPPCAQPTSTPCPARLPASLPARLPAATAPTHTSAPRRAPSSRSPLPRRSGACAGPCACGLRAYLPVPHPRHACKGTQASVALAAGRLAH